VSSATTTAATIHTMTAREAIAAPGLLRILPQLIDLIASEKLAGRARSVLRRYMGVSGVVGEHSFMTSSRSPVGGSAIGGRPDSAAERSADRP
jgi:hypothetical protein